MAMMTKQECIDWVKAHMEIRYATNNGAYTAKRTIKPQGAVNHSVGCAQPNPEVFYKNMNKSSCGWGVMALIGGFNTGDGKIIVTLPYNARCWGVGSGKKGSWNNTKVQWEICEPAGHTYAGGTMINYNVAKNQEYFDRMWKMVVAWNVYICDMFGYKIDDISDHAESYKAGMGSNHSDVGQWWPKHGKNMDALRAEVRAIMGGDPVKPNPPAEDTGENIGTPVTPYVVKVSTASGLNCRSKPVSGAVIKAYTNNTKLTISRHSDGWGYTGEGWVSLTYTVKVDEKPATPTPTPSSPSAGKDVYELQLTEAQLNQKIDERIRATNPFYSDLKDLPSYWREAIKALVDMDLINGGTTKLQNPTDINLSENTIKALVIMKSYIDTLLKNK